VIYKTLFFTIFLFLFSNLGSDDLQTEIVLENFESGKLKSEILITKGNSKELPEIRKSTTFTSPDLVSEGSLLVRVPAPAIEQPFKIEFGNIYPISDYVLYFRFHIFSNLNSGSLYFVFEDSHFEIHKIHLINLNFDGWKTVEVPVPFKVKQEDRILGKTSQTWFKGFIYEPGPYVNKTRENLLAIDDIIIMTRKKYKLFPEKTKLSP
jgi:hypothetical protein